MSGRVAVIRCISAPTASRNGAFTLVGASLSNSLELILLSSEADAENEEEESEAKSLRDEAKTLESEKEYL